MKQLLEKNERVWFYLNESDKSEFVKEVNDLNIKFQNGELLNIINCGLLMAISNNKLAYVTGFIWNMSFHSTQLNPLRVHYRKYKNNVDYQIVEPNFTYILFESRF